MKDQRDQALRTAGFDADRDIRAITVNRWPHGYAYSPELLSEPEWKSEAEKPWVIGRQPFGRIAIANSDAGAQADTNSSIAHAFRAVQETRFDTLAVTKLEVLDGLEEIKVCTGYRFEGDLLTEMPADMTVLEACQPVYESLPGRKAATHGARTFDELPKAARGYVERLSEVVGSEIGLVSTGPDRADTILRPSSWFD